MNDKVGTHTVLEGLVATKVSSESAITNVRVYSQPRPEWIEIDYSSFSTGEKHGIAVLGRAEAEELVRDLQAALVDFK